MIPFNMFGPQSLMGTNLFGAPTMLNDMPDPGMPHTGSADGVTSPLSGSAGGNSLLGGLGGADPDVLKPPVATPPPAGVPPPPVPRDPDRMNYAPVTPAAANPSNDPNLRRVYDAPPTLPTVSQGGVGPDVPPAAAGPATTGGTAPAAAGATNPDGSPKKSGLQDFLEKAGQMDFGAGQQQAGLKPASIGSAGQPHRPEGAAQLFASILEGRQKMMPKMGGVPEIPGVLARLGIGR